MDIILVMDYIEEDALLDNESLPDELLRTCELPFDVGTVKKTLGSVLSRNNLTVCGTGGMLTSETPSRICSTKLIEGLLSSSSWIHQKATLQILVTCSTLASLFNLLSSRLRISPPTINTFATKLGKNLLLESSDCSAFLLP
ncbi:hypothetical protein HanXRQr2_Chr17g0792121 [Helianthus annuus]|uniref:Uncharacterized protein n=1 Tax=Helianthus annuus TaxID=4232 RepID=A0A9K3GSU9_HELAN|nr:hypothetical protein HanXRQr2_Chr17g0792121 [Helianthus annuus]KAJ0812265.1 hypothetical protein HanPSC8_Chr17g0760091 [Helianthus annuus]